MDLIEFKNKLDNREFWGENSKEMWEAAKLWIEQANTENSLIKWSWDCGLKLDYDGGICRISSRFYPPHKNSEEYAKYDGTISVLIGYETIHKHKIEAETLDILKNDVEKYVSKIIERIQTNIKAAF